jgi:hypothetical protein
MQIDTNELSITLSCCSLGEDPLQVNSSLKESETAFVTHY